MASTAFTQVTVAVPPAILQIPAGQLFNVVYLEVVWRCKGQQFRKTEAVRVVPRLPISASKDDVRNVFGFNRDELEDDAIDLFNGYLRLQADAGQAAVMAALTSGTADQQAANDAIALATAVGMMTSLRLRAIQSTQNGDDKVARFAGADFDRIQSDIEGRYASAIADLSNTQAVTPNMLTVGVNRNPNPRRHLDVPIGSAYGGYRRGWRP